MAGKPHLIVIPVAAQGHVAPMMKLASNLVHHGIKVTFVNTVSVHSKIMSSLDEKFQEDSLVSFVSIPEMNSDSGKDKLEEAENATRFLQIQLQNLIQNMNQLNDDEPVTHLVADVSASWALKVANQMGVKGVGFVPYGLENFAFFLHTFKLIESGIVSVNGTIKEESICVSKDSPAWNSQNLIWRYPDDEEQERFIFRHFFHKVPEEVISCDTILVNSFHELESTACKFLPNTLPIGPLFTRDELRGNFSGNMWAEDRSCLSWLDQQSAGSVIYAAFGSTLYCSQEQLVELAAAFEMTGRPFLWVVRSNFAKGEAAKFPQGFIERVANYGKIVEWAPQEKVLSHRSIACFFSHCGWNSTMEGVSNGVPFLCWPYAWDQFHNRDNICKAWKVGLEVVADEKGIVTRDEIKCKIEKLVCDEDIKGNARNLKEIAAESNREGGSSFKNFKCFMDKIRCVES